MSFSGLQGHQVCVWCTDMHTDQTLIHVKLKQENNNLCWEEGPEGTVLPVQCEGSQRDSWALTRSKIIDAARGGRLNQGGFQKSS